MTLYGPEYRYGKRLRWWEVLRLALRALEYDNKYSLTNACGRARHALALLRQRLIEIKRL